MCGISGIVSTNTETDLSPLIHEMNEKIAHRGPDSQGFLIEPGIALGHRRLSIIDLSAAGNQPFKDVSGRYSLIYNGELYNYQEVKAKLSNHYAFQTQTDTEVVLAAYIVWGADCLKAFNGMFAFAIWDRVERKLFVGRDRLGIKPLYYCQTNQGLVFASEIRAILSTKWISPQINQVALVDYLRYQTVHAPHTIIDNINMLPSGSYALYQDGELSINKYWDIFQNDQQHLGYSDKVSIQQNIKTLLFEAVQRRLVSDVPLGAFLSGGIDSSAIVALMAQAQSQPVSTFSVIFEEKKYDESQYANIIAQKYNTRHVPILLKPQDFLDALPSALMAMDSPSGDGINSYVVSEVTKKAGITVALSGLGGDELFAGYPVFRQWLQLFSKRKLWHVPHPLRVQTANLVNRFKNDHKSDRLKAFISLKELSFSGAYPIFRQLASPRDIKMLGRDLPVGANPVLATLAAQEKSLQEKPLLSQVSIGEILSYTQNVLLRDTDQMSMAHALEVRVPFFDHELVEYVLGIPDRFKYPHTPKQLLVDALGDLLPDEVVNRPKMGFVFPWEDWLQKDLKSFATARLNQLEERKLFDQGEVSNLWNRFLQKDPKVNWVNIWTLVVLEEWLNNNV